MDTLRIEAGPSACEARMMPLLPKAYVQAFMARNSAPLRKQAAVVIETSTARFLASTS